MRAIAKNDHRLFYDKNNVIVRDSIGNDVFELAKNMRQGDVDEIWASHHLQPVEALSMSYVESKTCLTCCVDDIPVAMFGCTPSPTSDEGLIWMLATDGLYKIALEFVRYSRHFVDILLNDYPRLSNYVDGRNKKSIMWLKRIGAEIKDAEPHGIDGLPFHYFSFKRR
jgi:hypothetical protein